MTIIVSNNSVEELKRHSGCAAGPDTDKSKRAILVVSFGTSYSDTRELTIEATEAAFVEAYPDYDIRRAFTAQIVIDVLEERDGIEVDNMTEALERLKKEKYSEVIVQPTLVMNGAEYDEMVAAVDQYEEAFDKIVVGRALLTSHDDYEIVMDALKAQIGTLSEDEAVIFMGHGTHHFSDAAYAAMDLRFKNEGYDN
ncbi:Anaerobic cobalt chelatase like protein, partial [Aduncisulcus paluster]